MNKEERKFALDTANKMIELGNELLDKKSYEKFLLFKIEVREKRLGDYTLGEDIIIDEIKEDLELKNAI